jgi:hypothetical protein
MRGRLAFLTGLAVGFVAGTRAGRERYEQIVKLSRKAAENPTVQNVARTATAKAAELSKTAGQKATERMPKATATAKNSATKVRGQLDRTRGGNSGDDQPTKVNGRRSAH